MAPTRVQLSLCENNAIAALHKAGLKGPTIAGKTGHPLSTIYVVLKPFKQRRTVENEERSGRPFFCTPNTRTLYGVVKYDRRRLLQEVTNVFDQYGTRLTVHRHLFLSMGRSTINASKQIYFCLYNVCIEYD